MLKFNIIEIAMRKNVVKKYLQNNVQYKVCVEFDKIDAIISIMKLEGFEKTNSSPFLMGVLNMGFKEAEWQVGSEITGRDIWIRLKGYIDNRFSHSFLTIDDAEKMAKDILKMTDELKTKATGKCLQCQYYITNGDKYYEVEDGKIIHKNCIGEYLEKNILDKKLLVKEAEKFDTYKLKIEHLKK